MKINDTLLRFWTLAALCCLCSDTWMASDNTQCRSVSDCLTERNLADVCDVMVLISVENLWKYGHVSCINHMPYK